MKMGGFAAILVLVFGFGCNRGADKNSPVDAFALSCPQLVPGVPSSTPRTANNLRVAVTTTNHARGGILQMLDVATGVLVPNFSSPIGGDAVLRSPDGVDELYVINRMPDDNIQIFSRSTGQLLTQCSMGKDTNPYDIILKTPTVVYVSRFESNTLAKIDFGKGRLLSEIAMPGSGSDTDGLPEMAMMHLQGELLYVALQRLDRKNFWRPAGESSIAIVDTRNDSVVRTVGTAKPNPVTEFKLRGKKLYLGETGVLEPGELDGGIESFDPDTLVSDGIVLSEIEAGGNILDFEIVSDSRGLAIVSYSEPGRAGTRLINFDPRTRRKGVTIYDSGAFSLQKINWDFEDWIYVAEGAFNFGTPKVRVWKLSDGSEGAGFALPLQPYFLSFAR